MNLRIVNLETPEKVLSPQEIIILKTHCSSHKIRFPKMCVLRVEISWVLRTFSPLSRFTTLRFIALKMLTIFHFTFWTITFRIRTLWIRELWIWIEEKKCPLLRRSQLSKHIYRVTNYFYPKMSVVRVVISWGLETFPPPSRLTTLRFIAFVFQKLSIKK